RPVKTGCIGVLAAGKMTSPAVSLLARWIRYSGGMVDAYPPRMTSRRPPPAQGRPATSSEARAEGTHADHDPLARDPTHRTTLVGGQLPATRGLPGILYRALLGAAGAAARRPAGGSARPAAGGQ